MNTKTTTTLTAPEITCGGCANSIKKTLGNLEGVSQVEVEVPTKKVSVEHDNQINREEIVAALERSGFSTV